MNDNDGGDKMGEKWNQVGIFKRASIFFTKNLEA